MLFRSEAHEWYLLRQRPMTIEELVFGLRSHFGESFPEATLMAAPFHLAPEPTRHGRGNSLLVERALRDRGQVGIPIAPGRNETLCSLYLRVVPKPYLRQLLAEITADPACNPDALYRIPAEYDDEGYPVSTPARERV